MRLKLDETAYPHRDAIYMINVHGRWQDAADDERCVSLARGFFSESVPFATGGVYVNFMSEDETNRIESAYDGHLRKLAEIKRKYDPENLFRMNQNIGPA